jgi:hypothetical protein
MQKFCAEENKIYMTERFAKWNSHEKRKTHFRYLIFLTTIEFFLLIYYKRISICISSSLSPWLLPQREGIKRHVNSFAVRVLFSLFSELIINFSSSILFFVALILEYWRSWWASNSMCFRIWFFSVEWNLGFFNFLIFFDIWIVITLMILLF